MLSIIHLLVIPQKIVTIILPNNIYSHEHVVKWVTLRSNNLIRSINPNHVEWTNGNTWVYFLPTISVLHGMQRKFYFRYLPMDSPSFSIRIDCITGIHLKCDLVVVNQAGRLACLAIENRSIFCQPNAEGHSTRLTQCLPIPKIRKVYSKIRFSALIISVQLQTICVRKSSHSLSRY